jgi:hypothetical protein
LLPRNDCYDYDDDHSRFFPRVAASSLSFSLFLRPSSYKYEYQHIFFSGHQSDDDGVIRIGRRLEMAPSDKTERK